MIFKFLVPFGTNHFEEKRNLFFDVVVRFQIIIFATFYFWKVIFLNNTNISHFYDYHKIISYNCPVNILIGERGVGKSYGAKDYVIKKYLKDKSQFLYLRRYENELKSIFANKRN